MDGQSQKILNEATQTVVWSALTVGLILILLLAPGTIMCAVSWLMLGTPPTRLSFIGNTLFGWVFGPMAVTYTCEYTGRPLSMAIALAISGVLAFAVSTALRPLGPVLISQLVKVSKTANWTGAFVDALLRFFDVQRNDHDKK